MHAIGPENGFGDLDKLCACFSSNKEEQKTEEKTEEKIE